MLDARRNSMLDALRRLFLIRPPGYAPAVSVVVPIFNKARFLRASLDSVRQQSLQSLEIICVDDCSSDHSFDIARQCSLNDPRIVLLQTPVNSGPGVARNLGLAKARGEFIFFLDADDLLPEDALKTLHDLAVSTRSQLTKGSMGNFAAGRDGIWLSEEAKALDRCSFRLVDEPTIWLPYFFVCYLFSRRFLLENRIVFPVLRAGEDPVFLARCLVKATCISATSAITYLYRRDGSAAQRRDTPDHLQDFVAHAALVKQVYQRSGHGRCWYDGCESFYLDDVRLLMKQVGLDEMQRQTVLRSMQEIWPSVCAATGSSASQLLSKT
jgi:glycosyltransferase involved in cell wall biosynthesis